MLASIHEFCCLFLARDESILNLFVYFVVVVFFLIPLIEFAPVNGRYGLVASIVKTCSYYHQLSPLGIACALIQ